MMSSSLLENPVQAILYLRELTTIVQNQQSLIQTQRARIEELDRRVDELIGENRHLRDVRVQQQQPYHHHHHHHHHPDPSCLHHHHPQDPQLKTSTGSVPDHASAPAQIEDAPGVEQSPAQPLDSGEMQLVPTYPSPVSPVESDPENDRSCPSCRSLVPMTPTSLCRSLALAKKSE
ncbi:IQ motif and SEC7 domain-containing protein 3 [Channa argus]|uniref:IQ motif and SEC7 domain-containing protein 3 n=1 Tax=Channa argus TaxID=215402 RepID=A0A6G1PEX9_CHAAH|nr:IQ motif and SEC7 domain-containing protein 3 [Channa argus]